MILHGGIFCGNQPAVRIPDRAFLLRRRWGGRCFPLLPDSFPQDGHDIPVLLILAEEIYHAAVPVSNVLALRIAAAIRHTQGEFHFIIAQIWAVFRVVRSVHSLPGAVFFDSFCLFFYIMTVGFFHQAVKFSEGIRGLILENFAFTPFAEDIGPAGIYGQRRRGRTLLFLRGRRFFLCGRWGLFGNSLRRGGGFNLFLGLFIGEMPENPQPFFLLEVVDGSALILKTIFFHRAVKMPPGGFFRFG